MNRTAESSFAPLEYYKKLTNCLANRKNLKLNISKIQGSRDFRIKTTPFITNRKIQLKFLANYQMRKQFSQNQKEQREKLAKKSDEAIFKVKNNNNAALNEKLKRKTNEESYINLSDSYFKEHQVPDLSLFKVPGLPPVKKQRIEILPNTVNANNFTLSSLFSGNFNPPQYSTPIEKEKTKKLELPKPIISDPSDILGDLSNLQVLDVDDNRGKRLMAARELDKLKAYKNFIDDAASYVESVCFGELTDSIIAIIKKLHNKHEEASQSPRQSLISPQTVHIWSNVFSPTSTDASQTPKWPIPIFYDESNVKTANDFEFKDDDENNPFFENTKDLFSFLDEEDPLDLGTTAFQFDETPKTSEISFFNSQTPHPASNTFLASTRYSLTPYPSAKPSYEKFDDIDWLGNKFAKSMDMSWETGSNFTFASNENDKKNSDISAIFRSPPKTNNLESKKTFSRTVSRPKTYSRSSESEGFSDDQKDNDFSWWFNDNDNSPNNTFMFNDTRNIFDTTFSLF